MDTAQKISAALIRVNDVSPFYAYLANHLEFQEDPHVETLGTTVDGLIHYNKKVVDAFTVPELIGVLIHEINHLALEHHARRHTRDPNISNIAQDIAINAMLMDMAKKTQKMKLPTFAIRPENNQVSLGGIIVKDINKKTWEQIYDELEKKAIKIKVNCFVQGEGKGKKMTEADKEKWKTLVAEGKVIFSKERGEKSALDEMLLGILEPPKMNWKQIIYKYLTQEIIYDSTYARPSRRSQSVGYYMPSTIKRPPSIMIAVDTSGSISDVQLKEFFSEIRGIAEAFTFSGIEVIVCDAEIHSVVKLDNISDFGKLKIQGRGGTSHLPVYDFLKKERPTTRLLVALTDGYTSYPQKEEVRTLWVLNNKEAKPPWGEAIIMEDV